MPEDVPVRLRPRAIVPSGWPPDVAPNQVITAAHINAIRSSVYAWPGDVDGQGHTLSNVHIAGATGVMLDPTTSAGDLIARGASALERLPAGANGQVLAVDTALPGKLKWATPATAPVVSVFGRVGAVAAQAGDYTAAQVTGAVVDSLTTKGDIFARGGVATGRLPAGLDGQVLRADASQPFGLRWAGESVPSVFGRTGPVVAQDGDYTAAQVTGAVSVLGTYPDPAWIPSLAWTKLIGTPATFPAAPHTHDAAAVVSGVLATARLGTGVADASVYLRGDGTWAAAGSGGGGGVISVFGRAGTVIAQGGDYTAAQVTGAVVNPTNIKGDLMVRNDINEIARLPLGASGQVLQVDTSLSLGMKWTTLGAAVQTPWVTNIDGAGYQLANVSRVGVAMVPGYPLDVTGDINYSGTLRKNGAPVSFGGSQTPWTTNIDAAGFLLNNVGAIGIGGMASSSRLGITGGALAATAGAAIIMQSAFATTGNGDELSTTLLRPTAGSDWNTAVWRIGRKVDSSEVASVELGSYSVGLRTQGINRLIVNAVGNVGIGTASVPLGISPTATRGYLTLKGTPDAGVLELAHSGTDVTGALCGQISFVDGNQAGADKRAVIFNAATAGATAGNRGGLLQIFTKADGGAVAERVRITEVGNVGVGLAAPAGRLHVSSGSDASEGILVSGADVSRFLVIQNKTATGARLQQWSGSGFGDIGINPDGGRVGIGTGVAAPLTPLHVAANVTRQLTLSGTGAPASTCLKIGYDVSNNTAVIDAINGDVGTFLILNPTGGAYGRVGIGTTTPADLLTVGGIAYAANSNGGIRVQSAGAEWTMRLALKSDASGIPRGAWEFGGVEIAALNGVGIAVKKAAAGYPIDVSGDINISGTYRVNGAPLATGGGYAGITTQSDVTASRALNVYYTNSSGKPMFVIATVTLLQQTTQIQVFTSAAQDNSGLIMSQANGTTVVQYAMCSFWVLAGNHYKLSCTANVNKLSVIEYT